MSLKVYFDKDAEFIKELNEYTDHIWNPYGGLHIVINDEDVLEVDNGNFLSYCFSDLLKGLPKLYSGQEEKCPLEYAHLNLKSTGSKIILHITSTQRKLENPEKKYETELKDFAHQIIRTAQEYLDYVLERRSDLKKQEQTKDFASRIETAKKWYEETYKEKI